MHYLQDKDSIEKLVQIYKCNLLNVINFWTDNAIDNVYGGYLCSLDKKGQILDTDKGIWQTARFAWMLAHLYNNFDKNNNWLQLSKHGINFLEKYGFDDDGKMFFHVTQDGKPIRKRRYAFSESFAAIAFAEYAKASGENKYADKAIQAFENFLKFNTDKTLSSPKFIDSTRSMKGLGFPMIGIVTAQILRSTIQYKKADELIIKYIYEIQKDFLNPAFQAVMENVGPNGEFLNHFDGRILNPGHAIEAAWFIMDEGKYRKDPDMIKLGAKILDWMWEIGWDKEYGGILYFRDVKGLPVQEYWHDMKFWWPQCETIIASLLAFDLTKDEKYAKMHKKIHNWTFKHFPDEVNGEWYGYLHRDGRISIDSKGNLWKGPFHIPRMLFKSYSILNSMELK